MHAEYFSWEGHRSTLVTRVSILYSPFIVLIIAGAFNCCAHGSLNADTELRCKFPAQRVRKQRETRIDARSLACSIIFALVSRVLYACSLCSFRNDSYHIIGCAKLVLIVQILRRGLSTSEASSLLRFPRCSHCSTFLLRFLAHTLSQKKLKVEITR